jgi:hypothetical protein
MGFATIGSCTGAAGLRAVGGAVEFDSSAPVPTLQAIQIPARHRLRRDCGASMNRPSNAIMPSLYDGTEGTSGDRMDHSVVCG